MGYLNMKSINTNPLRFSRAAAVALLLLSQAHAEAAEKDKPAKPAQRVTQNTSNIQKLDMANQPQYGHCAEATGNCEARIRSGRTRDDTSARDRHAECHH
jgi:hypothetical protein